MKLATETRNKRISLDNIEEDLRKFEEAERETQERLHVALLLNKRGRSIEERQEKN